MQCRSAVSHIFVIFTFLLFLCILCEAACPTDDCIVDVDLEKFAGQWFTIAATPVTKDVGSCQQFDIIAEDSNSFSMNYTTISYRNGERIFWQIEGYKFRKNLFATWQLNGSPNIIGPFKHQILSIDYNSAMAIVICAHNTKYIPRQRIGLILSRKRELHSSVVQYLTSALEKYVDPNDIKIVNFTSCS